MATIFRPPLTLKVEPKDPRGVAIRAQQDVEPTADLCLELKGKDVQFAGPGDWQTYDYPNPRGATPGISLRTHTDPTKQHLIGKDRQFAGPGQWKTYDWPNPTLERSRHAGLRSGYQNLDSANLNTLKGQDKQFAGPGQWKAYDYPNPRAAGRSISLWSHTYLALALTAVVAQAPFAQEDWANPRGPNRPVADFVAGTPVALTPAEAVTNLGSANEASWPTFSRVTQYTANYGTPICLTVVTQAPFSQLDWPNPGGPQFDNFLRRSGTTSNLSLGLPGAPELGNVGDNVRGPTFRRTTLYDVGVWQTPLALFPTGTPFSETEWPNPRGPKGAPYDWEDSFKLPLQTLVPENQFDWPNPTRSKSRHPDWVTSTPQPILGSIQPFTETNYDWPNPKGPTPTQWRTWADSFKLPLQTLVPENQYDWPVPKGGRRNEQLGFTSEGLARTTVVVYPAAITFDYPNPRLPVATPRGFTDSFKLPLTTVRPLNQYDWPVPRGAKPGQDFTAPALTFATTEPQTLKEAVLTDWPTFTAVRIYQTAYRPSLLLGIPQQQPPTVHIFDWPNPILPRRIPALGHIDRAYPGRIPDPGGIRPIADIEFLRQSRSVSTTGPNLVIKSVVVYPATITFDWPNPRGPQRGQDWVKSTSQTLLGSLKPFTQGDWPVPKGAKSVAGFVNQSLNFQVTFAPFYQTDWPVPKGPRAKVSDWTDSFKLPLQTLVPRNQYDWVVPRGAKGVAGFVNQSLNFVQVTVNPFSQTDWPVPKGRQGKVGDWQQSFALPLTTVLGKNQYDWPNPRGQRRNEQLGWINQITSRVIIYPATITFDWPNPRGAKPKVSDWVDFRFIARVEPPPVIVPPEPVPPKHGHGHTHTGGGQTALDASGSSGRTRSSRGTTSSRWRKSRGTIRTSRSKTTPRDDP